MVNNSEDGVFSSYLWQTCDQVHSDLLEREGVFWGSDTIEGDSRSMRQVFVLLTRCAPGDIVGNPGLHPFPNQVVLGLSESLIPSRMYFWWMGRDYVLQVHLFSLRRDKYGQCMIDV